MGKALSLLSIILSVFLNVVSAQQADSVKKLPPAYQPHLAGIDIKHITIDLRFDWKKKQAYGTTAITLSTLNTTDKVALDAGMLTINSVKLSNGTTLAYSYDGGDRNDGLEIKLDRAYKPNEEIKFVIDYHTNRVNTSDPNNLGGSTGKGIRFFEPTTTEPRKRRQIWSMSDFESNQYWFPSYDGINDLRTTEFIATVDKGLMAISNGTLIKTTTNADGTQTFHWKMERPYANYQTAFVVGSYVDVQQKYKDIQLHNYGYPDEKAAVTASVERLPDMVKFFSEATGIKYPYPSYSQVFVQELPWGMSSIAASVQTENMVDDYGTHADFFYLWDGLEAEALAHQWFGNYITCADWNHIWLNRSFAHYFDALYSEHKNGRDEFLLWNHLFNQNTYLGDWNAGVRHPIVTKNIDDITAFVGDNYSYTRGALVLHMLRKQLGEEKWRQAIKSYVQSNGGKQVSTDDLQKAVDDAAGESMAWFFDQWLYKMGHPVFKISKNYDAVKKQLVLTVVQTQTTDVKNEYPQVTFFKGKIDIEIDGKVTQVWLEPKLKNIYTFQAAQEPKLVNFDYESSWIKEIEFEKTPQELLYQFQNDKDVMGRQWAMVQLVNLYKDGKTSAADKSNIHKAFLTVIQGRSYWRLRFNALIQLRGILTPPFDNATTEMLLAVIENEGSWNRATAINFLGMTKDPKYASLYIKHLDDPSDRVINAAAIALGKSKSTGAYYELVKLKDKPSWKNQSLITALNGLKELGDPRGADIALYALKDPTSAPRWTLATPIWDFRIAAAQTLVALGKGNDGYPIVYERFKKSVAENDLNDIFSNVLLIATLADPRGQEVFDALKEKYKDDANAMVAVNQYESQYKEALNKH